MADDRPSDPWSENSLGDPTPLVFERVVASDLDAMRRLAELRVREVKMPESTDEPPSDYSTVLREYLDLYAHQPPRQAELVIPDWALERLNALPEHQRSSILREIDWIASQHGLLTPTKVIVAPDA